MVEVGDRLTVEDEGFHSAGPERQWSDSLYFGGADPRGLAFFCRIGRRQNEGVIEGAIGVWLPDGGFVLGFARAEDGGAPAVGNVAFDCLEPFALWRIRLDGEARRFERAEHLQTARDHFETTPLGGELTFTAWHPPIEFASGLSAEVAQRHYEQPGAYAGVLEIGGRRLPLVGRGMRDHSWGVRDWQAIPYWRWFGMVVDPDHFVLMNNVGLREGGETVGGFLMEGGRLAPIVSGKTRAELDPALNAPRRFHASGTDELGRQVTLDGEALSVAPLRQRRDGRTTYVNEALTRIRWGRHEGVGLSEFLIQQRINQGQAAALDDAA